MFQIIVLGDVEVESVIMRDPEESMVPVVNRQMPGAGRPAHFYFRMPGGAWMLEETLRLALQSAATAEIIQEPHPIVGGFLVGWEQSLMAGNSSDGSAISVWPTLAPRSAIELDLFPRLPGDEKDRVFRIRHGHVTGWMQRAIEGLPANVANILKALRAFGECYKFYRDRLKKRLAELERKPDPTDDEKVCQQWLNRLKATLYAYIADDSARHPERQTPSPSAPDLAGISTSLRTAREDGQAVDPTELLKHLGAFLAQDDKALSSILRTVSESVTHLNERGGHFAKECQDVFALCQKNANANEASADVLQASRQLTKSLEECNNVLIRLSSTLGSAAVLIPEVSALTRQSRAICELCQRIDEIRTRINDCIAKPEEVEAHFSSSLLAEYILVISMKVQLVVLSVHSKEWCTVLGVGETDLSEIGNKLWNVCNQLCCSYWDSLRMQPAPSTSPMK